MLNIAAERLRRLRKIHRPLNHVLIIVCWISAIIAAKIFDRQIFEFIWQLKHPFLNSIMIFVTYLGGKFIVFFAAIVITFIFRKQKVTIPLSMALFTALAVTYILKIVFAVPRPFAVMGIKPLVHADGFSFPSGHSTAVFAVAGPLGKAFYKLRHLFIVVAILVAFSRVYLGVHYVSDVLAGSLIGWLSGAFFIKFMGSKWMKKINFLAD